MWQKGSLCIQLHRPQTYIMMKYVLNFMDSELSFQFCARASPQVILIFTQSGKKMHHNCAIQGACMIWKIWLAICELLCSLTNQNACFITFFCIQLPLFCTVLRKNCTVLSQSESSNFFMYIIIQVKLSFSFYYTFSVTISCLKHQTLHLPFFVFFCFQQASIVVEFEIVFEAI